MNLESLIFTKVHGEFWNLTLLICQLFMGGNFRVVNILHHPNAIDDGIFRRLDSVCLVQIPKTIVDISTEFSTLALDYSQRTDHILQLIFLPQNTSAETFNRIEPLFTFYRIFVFETTNETDLNDNWKQSEELNSMNHSSLLLMCDSSIDTIRSYILPTHPNGTAELANFQNISSNSARETFDVAFGEKASGRVFGVTLMEDVFCSGYKNNPNLIVMKMFKVIANLYFKQLNLNFMDFYSFYCNTSSFEHRKVRPITRSIYSDFSLNFVPISNEEK